MIRLHFAFLFIITCSAILFSQTNPVHCGVYELYTTFSADEEAAAVISGRIRSELTKTGMFTVMDWNEMEKTLRRQQIQFDKSSNCQTAITAAGHILALDRLVYGSVAKVKDFYTIVLRLLNVPKGEIVCTVTDDIEGNIKRSISSKAAALVQKLMVNAEKDLFKSTPAKLENPALVTVSAEPKEAEIFIDNAYAGRGTVDTYPVPAGDVLIQIGTPGYTLFTEEYSLDAGEKKSISKKLESLFGALKVVSKPKGVDLFLNDQKVSTTPYDNERIPAGPYKVTLLQKNFKEVLDNITIEPGLETAKAYNLRYTEAYRDSLMRERLNGHGLRGIRRIVFGSLAVLGGAAGFYFNMQAEKNIEGFTYWETQYNAATEKSAIANSKEMYSQEREKAETNVLRRNLLYGTAGVLGTCFVVSVFF